MDSASNVIWPAAHPRTALAVLCSGGTDSAVLLAEALGIYPAVHPLYIRTGMSWEQAEFVYLQQFLEAVKTPALRPLVVLDQPIGDVYGLHWSITGAGVPDNTCPDESVYLPGRNVLLLAKSLLWCHLNGVPEIAMAPLSANPFPDATPAFFAAFAGAVSMAVQGQVTILRPYAHLSKREVILRAGGMPLEHTFSCIQPREGRHCGKCAKCGERQTAFRQAGIADPTSYFNASGVWGLESGEAGSKT